jgi:hypothetical protein
MDKLRSISKAGVFLTIPMLFSCGSGGGSAIPTFVGAAAFGLPFS